MTQKKKGRPFSTEAKKNTRIAVKVTKGVFNMLKGAPKSRMLNDGLAILMPTLGVYIEDENRWVDHKESGTDANMVVYNSICLALDIIKLRREKIHQQHRIETPGDETPYFKEGYFSSAEHSLFNLLCKQKTELEIHTTFYEPID